jgi:hypothetical protein
LCGGSNQGGILFFLFFLFKCTEVKLFICVRLPDLASSRVPASELCDGQASHVTGQYSDTGIKQAFVDATAIYSAIAWGRLVLVMPFFLSFHPAVDIQFQFVSVHKFS